MQHTALQYSSAPPVLQSSAPVHHSSPLIADSLILKTGTAGKEVSLSISFIAVASCMQLVSYSHVTSTHFWPSSAHVTNDHPSIQLSPALCLSAPALRQLCLHANYVPLSLETVCKMTVIIESSLTSDLSPSNICPLCKALATT